MVNDTEPRYRLVDANGNVVGSFFAESDGTLKVQEGTSGDDNELALTAQGVVKASALPGGIIFAGAQDGADADARLDNALSVVSMGDTVFLESATYDSNRTITTASLHITSGYGGFSGGATVTGNWTVDGAAVKISNVRFEASVDLNGGISIITDSNSANPTINANADNILIKGVNFADINFASGTAGGVVTACTNVTVTDNGSNSIGTTT